MDVANRSRSIAVDGHSFCYFDDGQPTRGTVLLMHGFPDTPHSFSALTRELVAQGYRVLRPYLPGYAPHSWSGPFDVRSIGKRIAHFVEAQDVGPVFLVGHDWGALLGYSLLSLHSDLFLRGVTISVPHPLFALDPKRATVAQALRSSYILFFQLPWIPEALAGSSRVHLVRRIWQRWSPSHVAPPEALEEIAQCLVDSGSAPFAYYRSLLASLRARPRGFGPISVPLLYVHGAEDGCLGAEFSRGQSEFFAGPYREEVIAGAGHFVQAEAPERLARLLGAWFEEAD